MVNKETSFRLHCVDFVFVIFHRPRVDYFSFIEISIFCLKLNNSLHAWLKIKKNLKNGAFSTANDSAHIKIIYIMSKWFKKNKDSVHCLIQCFCSIKINQTLLHFIYFYSPRCMLFYSCQGRIGQWLPQSPTSLS